MSNTFISRTMSAYSDSSRLSVSMSSFSSNRHSLLSISKPRAIKGRKSEPISKNSTYYACWYSLSRSRISRIFTHCSCMFLKVTVGFQGISNWRFFVLCEEVRFNKNWYSVHICMYALSMRVAACWVCLPLTTSYLSSDDRHCFRSCSTKWEWSSVVSTNWKQKNKTFSILYQLYSLLSPRCLDFIFVTIKNCKQDIIFDKGEKLS